MNQKNPKNTQNYITSTKHVKEILNHTNINEKDNVIEIGSGKGHFTKELAKRGRTVSAIEVDSNLFHTSQKTLEVFENVTVLQNDILNFSYPQNTNYKIFGNIPFNISTEIVKAITFNSRAKYSYLIVEKGFSTRLKNLQRALGLLLMVEMDIKVLTKVPRVYFHPKPSVDSVLIVLERHEPLISKKDNKIYKDFVYQWVNKKYRHLFTKKQFHKAMNHAEVDDLNKISKEQFISIFNSYKLFN